MTPHSKRGTTNAGLDRRGSSRPADDAAGAVDRTEHGTPRPTGFHSRRVSWSRIAIAIAIPVTVAAITTGASMIHNSWNAKADTSMLRAKADTSDIRAIKEQLTRIEQQGDENGERLRQIICGSRVAEGCR